MRVDLLRLMFTVRTICLPSSSTITTGTEYGYPPGIFASAVIDDTLSTRQQVPETLSLWPVI
jgi:hypothetical protein